MANTPTRRFCAFAMMKMFLDKVSPPVQNQEFARNGDLIAVKCHFLRIKLDIQIVLNRGVPVSFALYEPQMSVCIVYIIPGGHAGGGSVMSHDPKTGVHRRAGSQIWV